MCPMRVMASMVTISIFLCLMLDCCFGAYVGQLTGDKLLLRLNNQVERLQLDLNAQVSSINCKHPPNKAVFDVTVSINRTDGSNPTGLVSIPSVKFTCATKLPVAALGPSREALPAQLTPKKRVFTYCLTSSASSNIFFGVDRINFMPDKRPISPLLSFTPLVLSPDPHAHTYSVNLQALKFNNKRLPVGPIPLAISTTEPYTRLVRPAYLALRDAFRGLTVQRVPPVPPFDTCFNASGLGSTRVGPGVPPVELQLAGNQTWTLFGANTMVFLKDNTVACVAFVDAGLPPAVSVVGKFQQVDNLIRFDLEKKQFGFTGVLYFIQTTCANFNSTLVK